MDKEQLALLTFLEGLSPGRIEKKSELESLLADAWDTISGNDAGGMQGYKLHGRIEDPEWASPILSFRIERHGGAFYGSTRAEIQGWEVDCSNWTADINSVTRRQISRMAPRLDVKPLAAEVLNLILSGQNDPRLKWTGDKRVRINIGKIIPDDGYKATVAGRRSRFNDHLSVLLKPHGWKFVAANVFAMEE